MTSEQPNDAPSASPSTFPRPTARPIRRRATDRVLGGVASGIADYFNIDPLIVRAVFVGLMIFGGSGLVLYVGAWLLIPVEGRDDSPLEAGFRRLGMTNGWTAALIVAVAAVLLFLVVVPMSGGPAVFGFSDSFLLIALVVILGVVLLRLGGRSSTVIADPSTQPSDASLTAADAGGTVLKHERKPGVPRGPLGMVTLAAAFIVVGSLALLDTASPDMAVTLSQHLGLGLAIVGIGLLIGSWWGNGLLLILPALVLLPIAWGTSYIRVPLEGGWGSEWHYIADTSLLQREYRLIAGDLMLDLRLIEEAADPVEIDASVAMGQITVYVPPDAELDVTTRVGAGGSYVVDEFQRGTDLFDEVSRDGTGPHFILDLATGIGSIQVEPLEPDPVEESYQGEPCPYEAGPDCYPVEEPYPIEDLPVEEMP